MNSKQNEKNKESLPSLPTLLITGASGFLGQEFIKKFHKFYKVIGIYNSSTPGFQSENVTYTKMDLTDPSQLASVSDFSFELILHTAALTNVDKCENQVEQAKLLNADTSGRLSKISYEKNAYFVQISTDQLYDGSSTNSEESDPCSPINEYGKTKLLGEELVRANNPNSSILRTNFYGLSPQGSSFLNWLVACIENNAPAEFYNNVFYTPICIFDLCRVIDIFLKARFSGTYNVVGDERVSKADFAQMVVNTWNPEYSNYTLLPYSQKAGRALRPLDMSLDNQKLKRLIDIKLSSISESLKEIKDQRI
tara:strand:- start:16465 stop:17391 length:927 start_codon:yes stop_codon:yes gene_type:complete